MILGPAWALPFVGMLLSIALLPALLPTLWHRRMDAVTVAWCLALLIPQAILQGPAPAAAAAWQSFLIDYLPLLTLLLALYVAGGGMLIDGGPFGTPAGNTLLLAAGIALAAVLGTTGAAMVLIQPLLRANAHRRRRAHLVVFFILLVANAGGGLSPLGPPLYIGFLYGVPFLWPLAHLLGPILIVVLPLLAACHLVDRRLARADPPPPPRRPLRIRGAANLLLVAVIMASVLGQSLWNPGRVTVLGQSVEPARLAGIAVCLAAAALSLLVTDPAIREQNGFRWGPMHEVALLFGGLFITIAPVLRMLEAGPHGALAPLFAITSDPAGAPIPAVYFWLTGMLSGFLDNAPTFLVFFKQAGGDAARLTGPHARTLVGISAGAVLFGGLSYIGNAPNLMVRAIAEHQAVKMPGFLAYVAIAGGLLLPCFLALTVVFLR